MFEFQPHISRLPQQYRFDLKSGAWTHRAGYLGQGLGFDSLYNISYDNGFLEVPSEKENSDQCLGQTSLSHYLNEAKALFEQAVEDNLVSKMAVCVRLLFGGQMVRELEDKSQVNPP